MKTIKEVISTLPLDKEFVVNIPKNQVSLVDVLKYLDQMFYKNNRIPTDLLRDFVKKNLHEVSEDKGINKHSWRNQFKEWILDNWEKTEIENEDFKKDFPKLLSIRGIRVLTPGTYRVSIRDVFNWNEGRFGDEGSCYFYENKIIQKFFNEEESFRAFLFNGVSNIDSGRMLSLGAEKGVPYQSFFNWYGRPDFETAAEVVRKIVQEAAGVKLYPIRSSFRNRKDTRGILYVNGGSNWTLVRKGETTLDNKVLYSNFDLAKLADNVPCDNCGTTMRYENIHISERSSNIMYSCGDCYRRESW